MPVVCWSFCYTVLLLTTFRHQCVLQGRIKWNTSMLCHTVRRVVHEDIKANVISTDKWTGKYVFFLLARIESGADLWQHDQCDTEFVQMDQQEIIQFLTFKGCKAVDIHCRKQAVYGQMCIEGNEGLHKCFRTPACLPGTTPCFTVISKPLWQLIWHKYFNFRDMFFVSQFYLMFRFYRLSVFTFFLNKDFLRICNI